MPRRNFVRAAKSAPKTAPKSAPKYEEDNEDDVYTSGDSDEDAKNQQKNDEESEDALEDSSDDESNDKLKLQVENSGTDSKPTTVGSDLSRLMYRKHKCVQATVAMPRKLTGADACSPEKPAELKIDKIKFHYIIHYIHRGYWNNVVPELKDDERSNVSAYQCNICNKLFRNNLSKKEFPARGTFLCHLATDHGKIVEAMKKDKEVDMTPVIELLSQSDEVIKSFCDNGTDTPHDDDLVTVKKDVFYNYTATTVAPKSPPPQGKVLSVPEDTRYLSCPKCNELKKNSDAAALKMHLLQHYKDQFREKLDSAPRESETLYYCDMCPSKKRFSSASPQGVRGAIMCHWAIQHNLLKEVLQKDPDISEKFIARLYKDASLGQKSPFKAIDVASRLQVMNKNSALESKAKSPQKRTLTKKKAKRAQRDEEEMTDESTTESEDDEELTKRSSQPTKGTKGPKSSEATFRKRKKIDFTLESLNDDCSEDEEYGYKSTKNKSKSGREKSVDVVKSQRPKRASAQKRINMKEIESDDGEY